jgi:hypothetical protein
MVKPAIPARLSAGSLAACELLALVSFAKKQSRDREGAGLSRLSVAFPLADTRGSDQTIPVPNCSIRSRFDGRSIVGPEPLPNADGARPALFRYNL